MLNDDFKKVANEINLQLRVATEALKKAAELARKENMEGLIYTQFYGDNLLYSNKELTEQQIEDLSEEYAEKCELIDVSSFENVLDECGWNTSSSYC